MGLSGNLYPGRGQDNDITQNTEIKPQIANNNFRRTCEEQILGSFEEMSRIYFKKLNYKENN